jgi:hypothetical protein
MAFDTAKLDEQISSLREGNTLTENEVKALCEKVSSREIYAMTDTVFFTRKIFWLVLHRLCPVTLRSFVKTARQTISDV